MSTQDKKPRLEVIISTSTGPRAVGKCEADELDHHIHPCGAYELRMPAEYRIYAPGEWKGVVIREV